MVVAGIDSARAAVQLAGKGRDLILLRFRRPEFRLNLKDQGVGRSRIKLTQEQSSLPATIQIKQARPEYVNIDLDQEAQRGVKVNVPTRGKPTPGFVVTSLRALENVALIGPQEEVNLMGVVNAETLNLSGLNSSGQLRTRLVVPDGRRFRLDPESVTVAVRVEREATRLFSDVAVSVFKPALYVVSVKPATAQIAVSGAADAINRLTLQDISATLKIADTVARGKRRMPCEITLPPGVALVKCEPALFDVEIK
jgi:hypothetical protein